MPESQERRGVTDADIAMAAKSNLSVDHRGGSRDTGSGRARRRRAATMFSAKADGHGG